FFSRPMASVYLSVIDGLIILLSFGNRITQINIPGNGFKSAVPEKPPRIVIDSSSQKPVQKPETAVISPPSAEAQGSMHKRIIVTVEAANLRAAPSLGSEVLSTALKDN